jgi:regulator of RNase E activity RraA
MLLCSPRGAKFAINDIKENLVSESPTITDETRDLLSRASTATITTQLFQRGLRNQFLNGVVPLNAEHARFVGEAVTLRSIPAREDLDRVEVFQNPDHPQRKAIETVGPGQVLVLDCRGDLRAANAGGILVTRARMRGAVGIVSDGAFRDSPEIARMPFPVFAAGHSATLSLAIHHAVDINVPIGCAGVAVFPGDILVGDEEGVVVIPRHLAAEIAEPAANQEDLERFIQEKVSGGAPLRGTYPPNEQTLAEYRVWREGRS